MAVLSKFAIEQQAQNQWCWAAVSLSVFRYFNNQTFATQCALVNSVFTPPEDCCQAGSGNDCDQSWDISEVLAQYGFLAAEVGGPLDFATLQQQIETAQAPVVIRVQFDDGMTDHFMAIVGCAVDAQGNQIVYVADPSQAAGNSCQYELAGFPENYRPGCAWVNTYQTQGGS